MKSIELYQHLEKNFITPELSDEWMCCMDSVMEFVSEEFKRRSMGIVCDFAEEIKKIYTAVFPSKQVMQHILADDIQNAMLFVHHPATWDIRNAPHVFLQMDKKSLAEYKKRKIAIYNLHVPLDNYGEYSTSATLAKVLEINSIKPFAPYFGALCGVIGETKAITVNDLQVVFQKAVGHEVRLYQYGDTKIYDQKVAVIAGGGNSIAMLEEIAGLGVTTFITGITAKNEFPKNAHAFAEKHTITILGGTHYSTEEFACIAMVDYFNKMGLQSEFIEDTPVMEDL